MKYFFIKQGKKETMENYFRKFLVLRGQANKVDFQQTLTKAFLNSTPFIKLKSKKRRKFIVYKIHPVDTQWARRKALGSFSKTIKEQKNKNFYSSLEKEFELLQAGKSNIQLQRDEYHRIALKSAPYKWRKVSINLNKSKN